MMDGLGTLAIVAMVLMIVLMCGGMILGAGWGMLHRQKSRRMGGARSSEPSDAT